MEQFFGNQCRFLNPHVKLIFGNWDSFFLIYKIDWLVRRRFPYDHQNCSMKFGSWTYDSSKVNLRFYHDIQRFDLKAYVVSNEWSIIGNSASRNTEKYGKSNCKMKNIEWKFFLDCCPEIYVDLKFYISLERRGGFYNYILILPCVLLSCLTCILFWLPVGKKNSLKKIFDLSF